MTHNAQNDRQWWDRIGNAIVAKTCEKHGHDFNQHGFCTFCETRVTSPGGDR